MPIDNYTYFAKKRANYKSFYLLATLKVDLINQLLIRLSPQTNELAAVSFGS